MRDLGRRILARGIVVAFLALTVPVVASDAAVRAVPPVAALAAPHDAGTIRETTDEVLSRRAYREHRPTWVERTRTQIRQWFAERLARLLAGARGPAIGWSVVVLATLLAATLLVRLSRTTGRDRKQATVTGTRPSARPPGEWLQEADRALGRGDLHEAIRAAYHAVIARLALDGIVEDTPGQTLGEQRAEVRRVAPALAHRFTAATDRVEAVLYGGAAPRREDVEDLRQLTVARTSP